MNLSINADPTTSTLASATPQASVGTPPIRFDKKTLYLSGARGTTGVGFSFIIQNRDTKSFKLVDQSFIFSGPDADKFAIVNGRTTRTVQPGAKAVYKIALKAGVSEDLNRVLTATLSIKVSRGAGISGKINLRAIATQGEGGNLEPSLQRIIDLYGYSIDVGDSNPATTALDLDGGATDEIFAQRFRKSGSGPVSIEPIAQFVSDAPVTGRLGYYTPGSPDSRTEIFRLASDYNQSVAPEDQGALIFDPGTSPFSLYAQIPVFLDDNEPRRIYGEDGLNTWDADTTDRRKVRVYQLSESGNKVEGAYIVTFEDYDQANDQNDYVYLIRGVTPAASQPEIGLIAQGNQPNASVLAFNEIGTKDADTPNRVLNTATVRIVNTGNQDLVISSIGIGSGGSNFQITSGGGAATIARNGTRDVTVKFTSNNGDIKTGTLLINSNDSDEPVTTVKLNGFWQSFSEADGNGVSQEPNLAEMLTLFGYGTQAAYSGQSLDTDGRSEAVGDEVLSGYWKRADGSYPVKITDLATFHSQGQNDDFGWYEQGKPWYGPADERYNAATNGPRNNLFFTGTNDGQTLLPRTTGGGAAVATLSTDSVFGLRVNGELSDDTLNIVPPGEDGGHHWRFYPARNADGTYIANTYLAVMDFSAINYDYNDNLFLIENVRPANQTEAVTGLGAYESSDGAVLDWEDTANASRYTVSRATSINGSYSVINSNVKDSFFVDTSVSDDTTYYYRVAAVTSGGVSGMPGTTRVATA